MNKKSLLVVVMVVAVVLGAVLFSDKSVFSRATPFPKNVSSMPIREGAVDPQSLSKESKPKSSGIIPLPISSIGDVLYKDFRLLVPSAGQKFTLSDVTSETKVGFDNCVSKRDKSGKIIPCVSSDLLPSFAPGSLIVKFKKSAGITTENQALKYFTNKVGVSLKNIPTVATKLIKKQTKDAFGLDRIFALRLDSSADILDLVGQYKGDKNIEYAEPNYIAHTKSIPNDPLYSNQWAHSNMQSADGWSIETGTSSVVISIIDTGVDYNHEDLARNIWVNRGEDINHNGVVDPGDFNGIDDDGNGYVDDIRGYDFVNLEQYGYQSYCNTSEDCIEEDNNQMDFNGHGTHVSGIAAAVSNNNVGIAGTCWNCKIMPLRAGWSDVNGFGSLLYTDIIQAIYYAANNGAKVINMSFGGGNSQAQKDALDYAYNQGIVLVAAAGNDISNLKSYPAGLDNVVSVSAINSDNSPAWFTNYGSWVDIAAPGVSILSTLPNNNYASWSGTSMATPYVAGLAGLVLSKNQNLTNEQVRNVLRTGVIDPNSANKYVGNGIVNIFKALQINSVPVANLSSSLDDLILSGNKTINIIGTAGGNNFTNYILEYGQGAYPTNWLLVSQGSSSVSSGLLGIFNTNVVPQIDGYTFRLKSRDNLGGDSIDKVFLSIDKNLKEGWPYLLSESQTAFVGSLTPAVGDVDKDGTQDIIIHALTGEYVFDGSGNLKSGWPTPFHNPSYWTNAQTPSASVSDLDGDGNKEVITTLRDYYLYNIPSDRSYCFNVYSSVGQFKEGWPRGCNQDINTVNDGANFAPIISDLNNDGRMELIGVSYSYQGRSTKIQVFNSDGSYFMNWPYEFPGGDVLHGGYDLYGHETLAVADVDRDGKKEIIGIFRKSDTDTKYLFIWNYNGFLKTGYPVKIFEQWESARGGVILADINNDEEEEIGLTIYGKLVYLNLDGSIVNGWPIGFYDQFIAPALTVGDLDRDGNLETVFGTVGIPGEFDINSVNVIKSNGENMAGWPKELNHESVWSQATIGDVNGDGYPDVLISTTGGNVYAWNKDGSLIQGFPKKMMGSSESGVAIGDVDGDGKVEIVSSVNEGSIYVWDINFSYDPSTMAWPQFQHDAQHTGLYTKPYVCGDANNDGSVNVADAVYLIDYIFSHGPAPNPLLAGDANGDGTINVADAVYLIEYIFSGGAAPCQASPGYKASTEIKTKAEAEAYLNQKKAASSNNIKIKKSIPISASIFNLFDLKLGSVSDVFEPLLNLYNDWKF